MKEKIAACLAALLLVMGMSALTLAQPAQSMTYVAPAAQQGPPGAIIKHMSNDPGLFSPFIAACGPYNNPVDISNPGMSTNSQGCTYGSGVNVFGGEEIWCRPFQSGGATQLYWVPGWHPWPYSSSIECEVKAR